MTQDSESQNNQQTKRNRKRPLRLIDQAIEEYGFEPRDEELMALLRDERFVEWFLDIHMTELRVWETRRAGDGELSLGQRSVIGEKLYVRKRRD